MFWNDWSDLEGTVHPAHLVSNFASQYVISVWFTFKTWWCIYHWLPLLFIPEIQCYLSCSPCLIAKLISFICKDLIYNYSVQTIHWVWSMSYKILFQRATPSDFEYIEWLIIQYVVLMPIVLYCCCCLKQWDRPHE